jgi:hypothetical protein
MVSDNVARVRENISAAAEKSGRTIEDITLVGVTKSVNIAHIRALLQEGILHLGENKVQEFLPKYAELSTEHPIWHFIGHLQRNKVKHIIDKVALIHSVDSIELANEIDKKAKLLNKTVDVLIEINIANEATKYGILPEKTKEFAERLFELTNIRLRGLMCVAPFVIKSEKNRTLFAKIKALSDKIMLDFHGISPYTFLPLELSMGMSNDYTVAIEEGATIIRIGTALVGERT